MISLVDGYLAGQVVADDVTAYRKAYIEKWFGPQDGRRCITAATRINAFLTSRQKRRLLDPIVGINSSPRGMLSAVLRHRLGKRPNEPLLRSVPLSKLDPIDKLVTRNDARAYEAVVAAAVV